MRLSSSLVSIQANVCIGTFVTIYLIVREPADVDSAEIVFKPEMAHQVYGETENIFGYKDLQINVYYTAGPLDIFYDVKYTKTVI